MIKLKIPKENLFSVSIRILSQGQFAIGYLQRLGVVLLVTSHDQRNNGLPEAREFFYDLCMAVELKHKHHFVHH